MIPATAGTLAPYWPSKKRAGATRFRALVVICASVIVLCLLLYVPVGILGYSVFGNTTASNILINFDPAQPGPAGGVAVSIARICVALCVFSGYVNQQGLNDEPTVHHTVPVD